MSCSLQTLQSLRPRSPAAPSPQVLSPQASRQASLQKPRQSPARARARPLALIASLVAGLALAGCASPKPGADLPPFGDSVRHTKALQTWQEGDEVTPLHGAKAVEAMRHYRLAPSGGQAPSSLP